MEPYLRQQFDLLLQEATGNYVERIVHRCGGPDTALARLTADPESEGVWVSEFVDVFFEEHLLDTTSGACFVLDALERRTVPADPGGPVAEHPGRHQQGERGGQADHETDQGGGRAAWRVLRGAVRRGLRPVPAVQPPGAHPEAGAVFPVGPARGAGPGELYATRPRSARHDPLPRCRGV